MIVHDMPEAAYHAHPALSSTGVRWLLKSPALYRYWTDNPRPDTDAFDLGRAVHAKILGTGQSAIAVPPEHLTPSGNISLKAPAVAWVAEQRAAGRVPVAPGVMAVVDAMAEAVLAHPAARAILERPGQREVSAFATDPDTGVACRARFDILADDVAADLKTTGGSASRAGFGRDAAKYGYPVQELHYMSTLEWASGATPAAFRFIVVEKSAPHLVAVHEFDEATRITADALAASARQTFAECTASGVWPGYGDDVLTPDIPGWWFYQTETDEEMTF